MGCKQVTSKKTIPISSNLVNKESNKGIIQSDEMNFNRIPLINVVIIQGNNTVFSNSYPISVKVGVVLHDVEYKLKTNAFINYITINNMIISDYKESELEKLVNPGDDKIIAILAESYLTLPKNIQIEYFKINILGKPVLTEGFEILIFNKISNELITRSLTEGIQQEFNEISNYNEQWSYCNGNNSLYITGNIDYSKNFNLLFVIDLQTLNFKKINNQEDSQNLIKRTMHTSLYIPNRYIFIIGSEDTKLVEYYDIEEDKIQIHSILNRYLLEPSCIVLGNFIYAFSGSADSNEIHIERVNLFSTPNEMNKWEIITPKMTEQIHYNRRFFAVSYYNNDDVLIIGGNNYSEDQDCTNTILYSQKENTLSKSNIKNVEMSLEFSEKLFISLSNKVSINFPKSNENGLNMLALDSNVDKLQLLNFTTKANTNNMFTLGN